MSILISKIFFIFLNEVTNININFIIIKFHIFLLNFLFIIIIFLISLRVFFFNNYYFKNNNFFYYIFWLTFFISRIIILITSKNIFFFFLGWDGLGISSFILVRFFKNWKTLNNRIITFFTNRMGDLFFIFLFYSFFFIKNFFFLKISLLLLILISLTKRAQFPFSTWLPAAISAPTPISSLVHSSTLVTAGLYLIFFFFCFNKNNP